MTAAKTLADSFLSPNASGDIKKFRDIIGFDEEEQDDEEETSTPEALEGVTPEPTTTKSKKNKLPKSHYPFVVSQIHHPLPNRTSLPRNQIVSSSKSQSMDQKIRCTSISWHQASL